MRAMFLNAKYFNQPIGDWDVSNVTDMGFMFGYFAEQVAFNQDLSGWNVTKVTKCGSFDTDAGFYVPIWTLPKPNFKNCTP